MVTHPVVCYRYDDAGYLREVFSPLNGETEGSSPSCSSTPLQATGYSYSSTAFTDRYGVTVHQLAAVTNYGTVSTSLTALSTTSYAYNGSGKLTSTTVGIPNSSSAGPNDNATSATSATTDVDYWVPLVESGLPTMTSTSSFAQNVDVPSYGVAIMPPNPTTGTPSSSVDDTATIYYLDALGRQVDVATYGDAGTSVAPNQSPF
jgi:YD repeat-containing protein